MGLESNTGLNVKNHYGVRDTGRAAGVYRTSGAKREMVIEITGKMVSDGVFNVPVVLPKGANTIAAYFEVTEAFDLGGTTPAINIGTTGSAATNGVAISEAQAEAVGSGLGTLGGTWADDAGFAANTTVAIALSGTEPTVDATKGRAKVIVEYVLSSDI